MAKGVSRELERESRDVLKSLIEGKPGTKKAMTFGISPSEGDAIAYLTDIGALVREGHAVRVSAYGREYWERINTPTPLFWFKQNWFPATVAFMTILASVTGAIANFVS